MNAPAAKTAVCIALLCLYIQATAACGVGFVRKMDVAGRTGGEAVLTVDVCHKSSPALDLSDSPFLPPSYQETLISIIPDFPPIPDEAVASAEPGETEKPPEC